MHVHASCTVLGFSVHWLLQVIAKVRGYVDDMNAHPDSLAKGQRGPYSK